MDIEQVAARLRALRNTAGRWLKDREKESFEARIVRDLFEQYESILSLLRAEDPELFGSLPARGSPRLLTTGAELLISYVTGRPPRPHYIAREDLELLRSEIDHCLDLVSSLRTHIARRPVKSASGKKTVQPLVLPPDTKWEDITIRFVDGHTVAIKARSRVIGKANYMEMGFENARTKAPNIQWRLLETLAERNGQIAPGDPDCGPKIKKRKEKLARVLKQYFQIPTDPFCPYRRAGAYKIRIKLIPD